MMGDSSALTKTWLLGVRPYGETSALLEVLSAEHGRFALVAKGARGARSRSRALLQPLQPLWMRWRARGELGSLLVVEAADDAVALQGERIFYAWYANELLIKLLQRHDPHPQSFAAYESLLVALAAQTEDIKAEFALRIFEKTLLAEMGYGLEFPAALNPAALYMFDVHRGFSIGSVGDAGYTGRALIALRDDYWIADGEPEAWLSELRHLARVRIRRHIADDALETPRLLRQMRTMRSALP
jgi:DNA repair protein RecO (recombination protein O)